MRSTQTEKPFGSAQQARKDLIAENHRPRKRKNGSPKTGAGDSSGAQPGIHLLTKGLRSYSLIESAMLAGGKKSRDGLQHITTMIDTEEKQLRTIQDLYAIVKAQPCYKKLKEPAFSASNPPLQVIVWLLRKLGPLAKGHYWTIDTYKKSGATGYRFVVFRNYHRQQLLPQERYIPLEFLPGLLKRDQPLHDLIIDTVALTSRYNDIPLWDEDGDFSASLKLFLSKTNVATLSKDGPVGQQYWNYKTGQAKKYLQLIKARRKIVTIKSVTAKRDRYNAGSRRKAGLRWWAGAGIRLAKTGKNISDESFLASYIPGKPVGPYRLYKFIWSYDSNDIVCSRTEKAMDRDQNNYGLYAPVKFKITYPGQKVVPLEPSGFGGFVKSESDFSLSLYTFMNEAADHLHRFRGYYYKEKKQKSSALLVDILADGQTENQIEITV